MACAASTEAPAPGSIEAPAPASADAPAPLDRAWRIAPGVALRPEPFGALVYHFGTRRLTFLKTRQLFDVVTSLDQHGSAREACRAAGVQVGELPRYERALAALADAGMIVSGTPV